MRALAVACLASLFAVACATTPERPARPGDPAPVPEVRFAIDFPSRALEDRTPGHVVTDFYVNGWGEVEDIEIVESEPEGLYDWSVRRSVRHWKYRQTIVAGERVRHGPIRTHFYFQFEPCWRPEVADGEQGSPPEVADGELFLTCASRP